MAAVESDDSPQGGMEVAEDVEVPGAYTLRGAAMATGWERETLRKRLLEAGMKPDRKRKYTLLQIITAMQGDAKKAKAAILQEQLRALVNENDEAEGLLLPIDFLRLALFRAHAAIAARLRASTMSAREKEEVLSDLARLGERDFAKEVREERKRKV